MARAPSVLIVQTNCQDGNKAQILRKAVHWWGKCSVTQGGKPLPGAATHLSPPALGGMNFALRFEPSWFLPGGPSPGEQIIACEMLGKPQVSFAVMTHLSTQNWASSDRLYGNLARFSVLAPCHITVADERVKSAQRKDKDSLKIVSGVWVCVRLHVCFCVSVQLEMFIPYPGCKMILCHLCLHAVVIL